MSDEATRACPLQIAAQLPGLGLFELVNTKTIVNPLAFDICPHDTRNLFVEQ